jgi:phosphate starvation-inducible protein PhoH
MRSCSVVERKMRDVEKTATKETELYKFISMYQINHEFQNSPKDKRFYPSVTNVAKQLQLDSNFQKIVNLRSSKQASYPPY